MIRIEMKKSVQRHFLQTVFAALLITGLLPHATSAESKEATASYRLASFQVDVTCPLGHPLLAGRIEDAKKVVDPLAAHGLVLLGAGEPIVFLAIDWCEIRNDAYDHWREEVAKAAGTSPVRVLLCSVHQHDAPLVDLTAGRLLAEAGLEGEMFDAEFYEQIVQRTAKAVRKSLQEARAITHLGLGKAKVEKVASNRRVELPEGQVTFGRGSNGASNKFYQEAPEGLIDPWLKTISFWQGSKPLAAVSAYGVHPMSYYGKGGVSADFVGMARNRRQLDDPKVHQIYVSGCSGDVTGGKYNDGAPANRAILADRLYRAMETAWKTTERYPLKRIRFRTTKLDLEFNKKPSFTKSALEKILNDPKVGPKPRVLAAMGLSSRRRIKAGRKIDLSAIDFGPAQLILFPGESFIGYQWIAQKIRPDSFVMPVGYGEAWTGYLPTEAAFQDGFDEVWVWVAPGSEQRIEAALKKLLTDEDPNVP